MAFLNCFFSLKDQQHLDGTVVQISAAAGTFLSSPVGRWLIRQLSVLWREKLLFLGTEITVSLASSAVRLTVFCLVPRNLSRRSLTLCSWESGVGQLAATWRSCLLHEVSSDFFSDAICCFQGGRKSSASTNNPGYQLFFFLLNLRFWAYHQGKIEIGRLVAVCFPTFLFKLWKEPESHLSFSAAGRSDINHCLPSVCLAADCSARDRKSLSVRAPPRACQNTPYV